VPFVSRNTVVIRAHLRTSIQVFLYEEGQEQAIQRLGPHGGSMVALSVTAVKGLVRTCVSTQIDLQVIYTDRETLRAVAQNVRWSCVEGQCRCLECDRQPTATRRRVSLLGVVVVAIDRRTKTRWKAITLHQATCVTQRLAITDQDRICNGSRRTRKRLQVD